jgi:hypothetical protein
MLTKLRAILLEEDLTATKLFEEANNLYYPGIQMYQLSKIISGKKITAYVTTYIKILVSLNSLTGKQYDLEDIIEDTIVENDLK